jgi:hypothetical protein
MVPILQGEDDALELATGVTAEIIPAVFRALPEA